MALDDFLANLDAFAEQAQNAFAAADSLAALEKVRIEYLGAKAGQLKAVQKGLGRVDKSDKPAAGQRLNEVKKTIENALAENRLRLKQLVDVEVDRLPFDVTVPGKAVRVGHLHPITQTIREMKEIMGRLGFTAVEGPEIEDDWHNFDALNIPLSHPARDPLDNFYLTSDPAGEPASGEPASAGGAPATPLLLRSQTSTVQIRVMENTPPPVRIISLGRVYRPDTADATH